MPYKNFPFAEVTAKAEEIINARPGTKVYQKFSCDMCGQRLTIDEPNVFHKRGTCDQCGWMTDIEKRGCNYAVVAHNITLDEVNKMLRGDK